MLLKAFSSVDPSELTKKRQLSHDTPFDWEGKDGEKNYRDRKKASQETSAT